MNKSDKILKEVQKQLFDIERQIWLFGAGASCESGIPLMEGLTTHVLSQATDKDLLNTIHAILSEKKNIEIYLTYLVDLMSACDKLEKKETILSKDKVVSYKDIKCLYDDIITIIGDAVRYGKNDAEIGTIENPITAVKKHVDFFRSFYKAKQGHERNCKLSFVTTNYDTLLEDGLALVGKNCIDGFSGGGIAFWNPDNEFRMSKKGTDYCELIKLHGSIDWYRDEEYGLVKVRYPVQYLSMQKNIMIYPQATKYVETGKDPFSLLMREFRTMLSSSGVQKAFVICGYGFRDEHINDEIEGSLVDAGSGTAAIILSENPEGVWGKWAENKKLKNRIFVLSKGCIWHRGEIHEIQAPGAENWWTFAGITKFLTNGGIPL